MKKIISLLLTLLLSAGLLTACGSKLVTLESVAKLNNCEVEDLNLLYDDEGQITFLSGKLSNTKITSEEEAYTFLTDNMGELLNMDDVNIDYYSKYVSPTTKVTYYRFQQTLNGVFLEEESSALDYLVNSIKLAVQEDGTPIAISSDLDHSQKDMDLDNIISVDEAEEYVSTLLPGANIYKDYTGICFWNDQSSASVSTTGSTKTLAYMVYCDNPDYVEGDDYYSPYYAFIISAKKDSFVPFITSLAAQSLTQYSQKVANTTLQFFDNKKDVGTYTYTVNFDWMTESDYAYAYNTFKTDGMEVSVPVMYCEEDGYYYLGNAEHYITMSNYCDFVRSAGDITKLNPYVSKNPEDLSSWHFKYSSYVDGTTYYDDPNYVIAAFSVYAEVVNEFGTHFDFYNQYPEDSYLLTTYVYLGSEYPRSADGFEANAGNGGQQYDWSYFQCSPCLANVLDLSTMAHEFSHGIHYHFTSVRYANEQGAVMESFADMIGKQMAMTLDEKNNNWLYGGIFGSLMRDFEDPNVCGQPQYINGLFYVSKAQGPLTVDAFLDYGGVHTNSGVSNYLGYSFIDGQTSEGEENITVEEGLNLWFETICLSNYDTEFKELGAILKYAVKELNYSDAKQTFVKNQIKKLGFEDGVVDQELLDGTQYQEASVRVIYEDGCDTNYSFSQRYFLDDGTNAYSSIRSGEEIVKVFANAQGLRYVYFAGYDEEGNVYSGLASQYVNLECPYVYHIKEIQLNEDETYTFDSSETIMSFTNGGPLDPREINSDYIGKLIFTKSQDASAGEFNIYIITAAE